MPKVEILQIGPYPAWDEEALNQKFAVHRYFEADDKADYLAEIGTGIRAIATRGELGADRTLIDALPALEIISVYGVGYDAVDLEAARERGIHVTNTPDVLTKDVADLGVTMMLAQARDVVGAQAWVKSGNWKSQGIYALRSRVHEKRAAILGMGRIGFEVAKRLSAFDMDISYSDLGPRDFAAHWKFIGDPVELAAACDFLFVTLSASDASRHIVGKDVVEALGPEGMLINISRASNVDEPALLDALETGRLGSAALDVFEDEPAINPRFLQLDNVLLQPHHASGTVETRKAMGALVYDNLVAHFEGRSLPSSVM